MHLPGERQHAGKTGQGDLAFVIVVTKPDAHLEGDGTLLDAADEQVYLFLDDVPGQFQGVGIIQNNGTVITHIPQCGVVALVAGLGAHQHHVHPQVAQRLDQGERLESAAHIYGRPLA